MINDCHAMAYKHCKMYYCLIENAAQLTDGWSTCTGHDTMRGISEGHRKGIHVLRTPSHLDEVC
jgi:hypothetical protein